MMTMRRMTTTTTMTTRINETHGLFVGFERLVWLLLWD